MNDFPNKEEHDKLQRLFAQASAVPLDPPPFLATRAAAHGAAMHRSRRQLFFWRFLSAGLASAFAIAFVFASYGPSSHSNRLAASVNKPHVVMVKVQELPSLAAAEIELPEGVYFYSESIPGLKERRELKLAWAPGAKPYLPFVVTGDSEGMRQVTVRLRDSDGKVLEERKIEILFRRERS